MHLCMENHGKFKICRLEVNVLHKIFIEPTNPVIFPRQICTIVALVLDQTRRRVFPPISKHRERREVFGNRRKHSFRCLI